MHNVSVRRRFIDLAHGQLHFRVAGHASSKPAILCLHMMPKSGRSFAEIMPHLAADRLVIAPDYPGYGESEHFGGEGTPSISDYADAVGDLIAHLELSKVNLFGYHTGSMVAVQLAHQYPRLINRVINVSAPIFTDDEISSFKKYYSPVGLDEAGTRFKTMWARILKYRGPGMTLEMAANSLAENLRGGERYEDGHYAAFSFSERYAELLERIEQPVLLMNLNDDLNEHTKRAVRHLNQGQLVEYPEWGHGFLDAFAQDVASVVLGFFDKTIAIKNK